MCRFCKEKVPVFTSMMDRVELLENVGWSERKRAFLHASAADEPVDIYLKIRFCPFCGRELK